MMLDSQAAKLDQLDRPEILAMLPSLVGKRVLELGAGIGRFTSSLATAAAQVTAVDFMANAIAKNKELNGHHKNVTFRCADVTSHKLQFREGSVDMIFSNWLLMYLSDDEVEQLAARMMTWLSKDGFLFFRESCFHQSGDSKRRNNPTHYREPSFYTTVFENIHKQNKDSSFVELQLRSIKCVGAYVRNKRNQNQVCWLWQKVPAMAPDGKQLQQFLDRVEYTMARIRCYERIFGTGFMSTGGLGEKEQHCDLALLCDVTIIINDDRISSRLQNMHHLICTLVLWAETTKAFVAKLGLQKGHRVLDVGCGIGGGAFYMAEEFDADVTAIDVSVNMISLALERAIGQGCVVEFEVADCMLKKYPPGSFDVVCSRDSLLHIQDKATLFSNFCTWLRPGGKLLISDYCQSEDTMKSNTDFQAYAEQHKYFLPSFGTYGRDAVASFQLVEAAGFTDVIVEDRTKQFVGNLRCELAKVEENKTAICEDFSQGEYNTLVNSWKSKLEWCARGDQKWGLFTATKPLDAVFERRVHL
eukprot:SM000025S08374  [mRNA]  locus=s25:347564:350928:- [translate_table: standard]